MAALPRHSSARAIAGDLGLTGSFIHAEVVATAQSAYGTTKLAQWGGIFEYEHGAFSDICYGRSGDHIAGRLDCGHIGRPFGIPEIEIDRSTVGNVEIAHVTVIGASAVAEWLVITTDSGGTVVARFVDGLSYAEWSLTELGEARRVQVLKSSHAEFWSETYES